LPQSFRMDHFVIFSQRASNSGSSDIGISKAAVSEKSSQRIAISDSDNEICFISI